MGSFRFESPICLLLKSIQIRHTVYTGNRRYTKQLVWTCIFYIEKVLKRTILAIFLNLYWKKAMTRKIFMSYFLCQSRYNKNKFTCFSFSWRLFYDYFCNQSFPKKYNISRFIQYKCNIDVTIIIFSYDWYQTKMKSKIFCLLNSRDWEPPRFLLVTALFTCVELFKVSDTKSYFQNMW